MGRLRFPIANTFCILLLAACGTQPPAPTRVVEIAATATLFSPPPPASVTPTTGASPSPASTATMVVSPTVAASTAAASPDASQLASWTSDQADQLIAIMEEAVLATEIASPGPRPPYQAAWYAIWDALAHFPDDPRADGWRWKLPYYMAWSGDGAEATQLYADLISKALNEQGIVASNLPTWFHSGELTPTYFTAHFELNKIA